LNVNWEKKWGTKLIFTLGKLHGCPLAEPEYVPLDEAIKVARWAANALQENERCVVYTFASSAVRICIAAAENNVNISGTKFLVTGEPLTPQKRKEIEALGASPVPVYGISEAGVIAAGCDQDHADSDHCHLYQDATAIISHRQGVPHSDLFVDSYLFTTLLYESPKLLLNVGMGDYGDLSEQKCDCAFGQVGFNTHLSGIRSYEKLTGEGVTFVDTDFIRIIERELPERFGGRSTDYQLVEKEDSRGLTHLRLLVSPRVGEIQEIEVLDKFLNLLRRAEDSPESWSQSGTEMWKQSNMVQIVREFPIPTASGKILPFFVSKPKSVPSGVPSVASQKR
jgi:phenylacetate-coenzyme A ligase PaaK-like adenylate-forming protein